MKTLTPGLIVVAINSKGNYFLTSQNVIKEKNIKSTFLLFCKAWAGDRNTILGTMFHLF